MHTDLRLYLTLWIVASLVMHAAWLLQKRTRNAGLVDVLWAGGIGVSAVVLAVGLDGWEPRRLLVGALGLLWSARLSWHLWTRFRGEAEDGRYADLRSEWGERFERNLMVFHQVQAAWIVMFASAFWAGMSSSVETWLWTDLCGLALALVAMLGEGVADRQLARWRRDQANRGKTCRAGLWRYSRHPNYFFEWTYWLSMPVIALPHEHGWLACLTPALLFFLITKVTGIPPTEERSLRSRGEDYRAYQRTTNAFFPGPVKADPHAIPTTEAR